MANRQSHASVTQKLTNQVAAIHVFGERNMVALAV
jgi:hypothetical protein